MSESPSLKLKAASRTDEIQNDDRKKKGYLSVSVPKSLESHNNVPIYSEITIDAPSPHRAAKFGSSLHSIRPTVTRLLGRYQDRISSTFQPLSLSPFRSPHLTRI